MSDTALMIFVPAAFLLGVIGIVVFLRREDAGQDNDWFWGIVTFVARVLGAIFD